MKIKGEPLFLVLRPELDTQAYELAPRMSKQDGFNATAGIQ